MRGVVVHAPKDLRVQDVPEQALAPDEVRVGIAVGGICGSDLHYYNHGGTGAIRLREPMVLGHEVAGTVTAVGAAVSAVAIGARVAVNPSLACGVCEPCREGLRNHCRDMRFLGSAMRFPHVQGGFRETLVVRAAQAVAIGDHVTLAEAAMAEPLAVCLHAVGRAGRLDGRRVLVTGSGPIGVLTMIAARLDGAASIVVTDVQDFARETARAAGADLALNVAAEPDALARHAAEAGPFDVVFEASGNAAALRDALPLLRPRGTVVQLGLGGDIPVPVNIVVTRELDIRGTFRFDAEFARAVELMNQRRVNLAPLVTATLPFGAAEQAFHLAGDRSRACKVQLSF
jgi:L-idonate 5-dehydrogenase